MRVTTFETLPAWLQASLARDWENVTGPRGAGPPPIRDPEYRVYELGGTGWWAVDSGTGGVTVEREGRSYNYDDIPEGELKELVDREGRAQRDRDNVKAICQVIRSHGVNPLSLGAMIAQMRADGASDADMLRTLAGVLHDGLRHGTWIILHKGRPAP